MFLKEKRIYTGEDESEDYPGFYLVPGLMSTLINTAGVVIDLSKNWCPLLDLNPDGYPCVNSDNDRQFIHRLLALTFLPMPNCEGALDVNHIDGVKRNFALSNLEWATRSENCFHAYRTGLRSDNVPVLVKDLRTGNVTRFYSLHECARCFKTDAAAIFYHLKPKNYGKVVWNYYLFIREGDAFPKIDPSIVGTYRKGSIKPVIVQNIEEGYRVIADSLTEAARGLGFKPATVAMHVFRHGEKPYKGWKFTVCTTVQTEQEDGGLTTNSPTQPKCWDSISLIAGNT